MKKIKNSHILIVAGGSSLKKYWTKIERYIKENECITFGCNHMNEIFIPDYHFWGSSKRWRKFGDKVNANSQLVFPDNWAIKLICKHRKEKFIKFRYCQKKKKISYENGIMNGNIKNIGMWAIFYAYTRGAAKIHIVGMDGYTFYSKEQLDNKEESQHCFGEGYSNRYGFSKAQSVDRRGNKKFNYTYSKSRDEENYNSLTLLYSYIKKKYGFSFKIITPTIFKDFYDSSILNIKE